MQFIEDKKIEMENDEDARYGWIEWRKELLMPGFYTTEYDFPVCNHTEGVTELNLGYSQGITYTGVPFEAEIFENRKDGDLTLAVIMPAIYQDATQERAEDNDNTVIGFRRESEWMDYSILDYGMVDDGEETNDVMVYKYVEYLIDCGIIDFATDISDFPI